MSNFNDSRSKPKVEKGEFVGMGTFAPCDGPETVNGVPAGNQGRVDGENSALPTEPITWPGKREFERGRGQ